MLTARFHLPILSLTFKMSELVSGASSFHIACRPGEIVRVVSNHAILAQPNDSRGEKARVVGRIPASVSLLATAASRLNALRRFEPAPQPSLRRLLLRFKVGLRSHSDDGPSGMSV
jgi:hypothetical protein